ncbi:hypothetical protein Tco_0313011 [Tanacetum coccineum]
MSVRLADRSFQFPVGIAGEKWYALLVEVVNSPSPGRIVVISRKWSETLDKVPLILGRTFLHTAHAIIRVKQKQLNLGVGTERIDL